MQISTSAQSVEKLIGCTRGTVAGWKRPLPEREYMNGQETPRAPLLTGERESHSRVRRWVARLHIASWAKYCLCVLCRLLVSTCTGRIYKVFTEKNGETFRTAVQPLAHSTPGLTAARASELSFDSVWRLLQDCAFLDQ